LEKSRRGDPGKTYARRENNNGTDVTEIGCKYLKIGSSSG
jgi:hypothetical protein